MTERIINFGPGPCYVAPSVEKEFSYRGFGPNGFCDTDIPIDGISHRSPIFLDNVLKPLNELTRKLLKIPDNYAILWTRDGATEQWSRIVRNFNVANQPIAYVDTGDFAKRAIKAYNNITHNSYGGPSNNVVFPYREGLVPRRKVASKSKYMHITWNNTVEGVEFNNKHLEYYGRKHTLILDATSNIFSREVLWGEHNIGMIYASTTKQMGGPGNCLIIIRDDLLVDSESKRGLSDSDSYSVLVEKDSGLYTSNVEGLLKTLIALEGYKETVGTIESLSGDIANILYDVIDSSEGFYRGHSHEKNRSSMNVVFYIDSKNTSREKFLEEAEKEGLMFLKGHKVLPNSLRASIYNMMPIEYVERLAKFMREFQKQHA